MKNHNLTDAQINDLIEAERMMDDGQMPFVIHRGNRLALNEDTMRHFKFTSGQTIGGTIFDEILKFNIKQIEAEIKARKNPN